MANRKVLMVVRAGDRSLHPQWIRNEERLFDLHVSYFGLLNDPYPNSCERIYRSIGSKWVGLADFIRLNPGIFDKYDYICFPDDDILSSQDNINNLCGLLLKYRPHLAQPALALNSYFSHKITLYRPFIDARRTDFVEVMFPCFRSDFLREVSWTFSLNTSGWGLEWLWIKCLRAKFQSPDIYIFDSASVLHTRPVGLFGSGGANGSPHAEEKILLSKFGLKKHKPKSFGIPMHVRIFHWFYIRSYFLLRNLQHGIFSMTIKSR